MAQRPRVDSLSTFEDFWSQKREEVDEEGDIDVGEPGDAILPPDPAPHAPVHRRSRVPSEEDLSHAEDLLSVSHGERDTRGGGDSGHNSPSLTPALTARRLMGDASPIINPLGGAGRIPSHEDLKGKCSSRNLLCSPRLTRGRCLCVTLTLYCISQDWAVSICGRAHLVGSTTSWKCLSM